MLRSAGALMALLMRAVLMKAGPWALKQLPKLWPLLLDPKNRDRLQEVVRDLASNSPTKRLRGKVELTAALADQMVEQADSEAEREQAREWSRRARNLTMRLDMPVVGLAAKRSHRQAIARQLEELQGDIDRYLAG